MQGAGGRRLVITMGPEVPFHFLKERLNHSINLGPFWGQEGKEERGSSPGRREELVQCRCA